MLGFKVNAQDGRQKLEEKTKTNKIKKNMN